MNYDELAELDDGSCEYPDNGNYSLNFDGSDDYVEVEYLIREIHFHLKLKFSYHDGDYNKSIGCIIYRFLVIVEMMDGRHLRLVSFEIFYSMVSLH